MRDDDAKMSLGLSQGCAKMSIVIILLLFRCLSDLQFGQAEGRSSER